MVVAMVVAMVGGCSDTPKSHDCSTRPRGFKMNPPFLCVPLQMSMWFPYGLGNIWRFHDGIHDD